MKKVNWVVLGISLLSTSYGWSASGASRNSSDHTDERPAVTRVSPPIIATSPAGAGAGAESTGDPTVEILETAAGFTIGSILSGNSAGVGAGAASESTADLSAQTTGVSAASTTIVSESITLLEPVKPGDLNLTQILENMISEEGRGPMIKSHPINGIEAFFAALQGVTYEIYSRLTGIHPFMPFLKWVVVTPENKSALGVPAEITPDGNYAVQLAYFFPKAFGVNATPRKLVVSLNLNGAILPETWVQPYEPYETKLAELDEKFSTVLSVLNPPATDERFSAIISEFMVNANIPDVPGGKFRAARALGIPDATKEDLKFFADYGIVQAQNEYLDGCHFGRWGEPNYVETKRYLKVLADQYGPDAQFKYANYCISGNCMDLPEARKYFKSVSDQGIKYAQYNYALMCKEGEGGLKDLISALEHFEKAAAQGYSPAVEALAVMNAQA